MGDAVPRDFRYHRYERWRSKERFRDEHRHWAPDLEQLDERQAQRFLEEMFSTLSAEKEYALRYGDCAMEMPQSGERIRGPENMRAFQQAFASNSTPPSIRIRRGVGGGGGWVVEGVNDYGEGQVFSVVLIIELRDEKMWRGNHHYAGPFQVPRGR